MQTFNSRLAAEFKALAEEEIQKRKDDLANGQMTPERYQSVCGQIAGLREAQDLIEGAVNKVEGVETRSK
jgi:hypothetical protein